MLQVVNNVIDDNQDIIHSSHQMMEEIVSHKQHRLLEWMANNSNRRICIYGIGVFADRLFEWLCQNDICIEGFLVDRGYLKTVFHKGVNVYEIDDYFRANKTRSPKDKPVVIVSFVNYDEHRFVPYLEYADLLCCDIQGLFAIGGFDYMDARFIENHSRDFRWLEENLEDEKSVESLRLFLFQKVTGVYKTSFDSFQYFPTDIISLSDEEVFVDCGAYDGDSVEGFVNALQTRKIKSFKKIIAFEPDVDNQAAFEKNTEHFPSVHFVKGGVWNHSDILHFVNGTGASSLFEKNGRKSVPVYSIDEILNGEKATYIKMDIEGSELDALYGAEKTIKTWRPKLAVSVYHKKDDLISIPQYIKKLVPEYKLFIRKYASSAMELVLYAV